ncbi:DUF6873 family GME fold protein [Clostridium baratii]|uniref:DUF6873 family GME fold protein n=1 Tax=Clostridium baratii TaxID=1561 RepID=UPI001C03232A|nr:hypothetical protein [Clostridium baratii]MBT9832645.1 hypothetical protein [Clostridium baratii]
MYSFVDYRITEIEFLNLKKHGVIPIKVPKTNLVYDAINGHPDIQLSIIDSQNKHILVHKDIDKSFIDILNEFDIKFSFSKNSLENKYPYDIILNSLISDNFLMHNLKFTDPNLLSLCNEKTLLDVKQGYTKCSVLKIKEDAFITSDKVIFNKLNSNGYDTLLVPPSDIILEGLDYGFIGGTGGMIDDDHLAFFGSLDNYLYGDIIKLFLSKHGVTPIYLSDSKLIDRGSILSI